jgi:nucleotide-binding universal stress UspA family protein
MTNTLIPAGTIVVGLDGSPSAARALAWAIAQAVREHRPLTLAHAIDHVSSLWVDPSGASRPEIVEVVHEDAQEILRSARAHVEAKAPGLVVHEASWSTDPRPMLLDLAGSAHLVVVGSRGRGPVTSLLLGSVGVAVIRHATCPVVVVRPTEHGAVRHGVLVGADGRPSSRETVEYAYLQASLHDLPLTIMHGPRGMVGSESTEELRLQAAEPLSGLAEKYPDVRARLVVATGLIDEELILASERMNLIVLGAHHGGRLSALVNGSVAQIVVEHAHCPVAVVPVLHEG